MVRPYAVVNEEDDQLILIEKKEWSLDMVEQAIVVESSLLSVLG